jgi:hypothetical protein
MSIHVPSAHADAIENEHRLFQEQLEAKQRGDWAKCRRLLVDLARAKQKRLELTPPPPQ